MVARGQSPVRHRYVLHVTKIRGRDRYQAVCDCGTAGQLRWTEDMAEADYYETNVRNGRWPK